VLAATLVHVILTVLPSNAVARGTPGVEIVSPEGYRARLPSGFEYARRTEEGRTVHVGTRRDGTGYVAVTALTTDEELDCEDGAGAGQSGDVALSGAEPFTTAAGVSGCLVGGEAVDGAGAIAIALLASGETVVVVNAIAVGPGTAFRLARSVAETVQFRSVSASHKPRRVEVPVIDPRAIGCFERLVGVGAVSKTSVRCYRDDLTFTETTALSVNEASSVGSEDSLVGGAVVDGVPGRWSLEGGTLWVQHEGQDALGVPVELYDDAMILWGAQYWKRVR
jgi:hypothetical protein